MLLVRSSTVLMNLKHPKPCCAIAVDDIRALELWVAAHALEGGLECLPVLLCQ
jgi:hypothetical protein